MVAKSCSAGTDSRILRHAVSTLLGFRHSAQIDLQGEDLRAPRREHHRCLRFHALLCFPLSQISTAVNPRIHDTSFPYHEVLYANVVLFQWFARMFQASTVLAPSTMYFPVAAPPECRGSQIVSQEYRDRGFFTFHKVVRHFRSAQDTLGMYSQLLLQGMVSVWLHS